MKTLILILTAVLVSNNFILVDFSKNNIIEEWYVVDDVVMGGRSGGNLSINDAGNALFNGKVSLENNGGFSSIRHRMDAQDVSDYSSVILRLKGDGKKYQFRIKSSVYNRFSYIYTFETSGEWENIEIPFAEMYPGWRGMKLKRENFSGDKIEEIAFLIGNKVPESFALEIDNITLNKTGIYPN